MTALFKKQMTQNYNTYKTEVTVYILLEFQVNLKHYFSYVVYKWIMCQTLLIHSRKKNQVSKSLHSNYKLQCLNPSNMLNLKNFKLQEILISS